MSFKHKIGLSLLTLCVATEVLAQPSQGYQVGWGTASVPLSPWSSALIALMLVFSAYAFLRKRGGRAMMMLAAAALVGALGVLGQDRAMAGGATDTISTPAGSMTLYCNPPFGHFVATTVPGGVTLTVIPINGAAAPAGPECATGTHLNPGDICSLCGVFG